MVYLRADIKRAKLRSIWRNAKPAGVALDEALASFQEYALQQIGAGRPISSTSGGGYSTSFQPPSGFAEEMTPTEMAALSEFFFSLYTAAVQTLTDAGTPIPDDKPAAGDLIFESMIDNDLMQSVRERQTDHTMIRWPNQSFL